MSVFEEQKKKVLEKLGKPDKSKKGTVDEEAWPFINTINSLEDYYTTSSCAGRITLFKEAKSGKKHESDWLFVSHQPAKEKEVIKALKELPEETVWFRMESPIFHVACKNKESAEKLLKICQSNGWKRSGIISTGGKGETRKRIMIEILGNERIDTPIAANKELIMDEKFVKFLVKKANEKLNKSRERLEELRKKIEEELKK